MARIAVLTVCHAAPRPAAIRLMDILSMTRHFIAYSTADCDGFARGAAIWVRSSRQIRVQVGHR
ncbi:hypothetical protein CUROG_05930 [Corynebacterium urogenitale]|uniref:Uncharacterized protein n=1 Tax=Corynebacterium urogenitale TaxID=2487892 RepID=A0A5J6ZB35_9CORY|nr:hypothetical protein CUROG_05930 [Corynebacterium urogenitale]